MLAKKFRLIGKDISFLIRKRQFIPGGLFNFFYIKQYSNHQFNQISITIPLKFDKRATQRRIVKRAVIKVIEQKKLKDIKIKGQFYKVFVFLNKKMASELAQKFASLNKKDKMNYIEESFHNSRKSFSIKVH